MRIEVVDSAGESIVNFDLESNPFKVGETLFVRVSNYDKEYWNKEEVRGDYLINKIEHYLRQDYTANKKCHTSFIVSVEVSKIK